MNKYRDYLQTQQFNIRSKQKKRRHLILMGIMVLAIVLYIGMEFGTKNMGKEFKKSISDLDWEGKEKLKNTWNNCVETISEKWGIEEERKLPIYCVDRNDKKIALSFDAAWGAEDFEQIMGILDKHKVKVTFFMTGSWVEDNEECVKKLADKGHDLGNHSQHHYDMTSLSREDMKKEIEEVHNKVKEIADYDMNLFRPPYGAYNDELIEVVAEEKYYALQWSVDSLDWKDYGVDSIIEKVCKNENLGPGAIILCHNGAKYTAKALDKMLTNLEEQGYEIVPISELIIKDNYHIDVTGKQIKD